MFQISAFFLFLTIVHGIQTGLDPQPPDTSGLFLNEYHSKGVIMLLVDSTEDSQNIANEFYSNLKRNSNPTNNFWIMKFNTSGVTSVLEASLNNPERFKAVLSEKPLEDSKGVLGKPTMKKSSIFYAILNAAQKLPLNSAIILFTNREVADSDLAQLAWNAITKKNIRVFVIWSGKPNNSERILQELAFRSNGAFWQSPPKNLSQQHYEDFLENSNIFAPLSAIYSGKNLRGQKTIHFPVDSGVTSFQVLLSPSITEGILTTPKGLQLYVCGSDAISNYSTGSFMKRASSGAIQELFLNNPDVGLWRFLVNNARADYNVEIFAHTKLQTNVYIAFDNSTENQILAESQKVMRLGFTDDISAISNITFFAIDGHPINKHTDYQWKNELTENIDDIETNHQIQLNITNLPKEPFYVLVNGKDTKANDFTRLSYVSKYLGDTTYRVPPITIELGAASEVLTQPNRQPELYFEVTNNGNSPVQVRFYCQDEKAILLQMNPWYKLLNPQETTTVRVTLITRPGTYTDLVTFSAKSLETIEKKVLVEVGSNQINYNDRTEPSLDYTFKSDCLNVLFSSCEGGSWTVEIRARDSVSGLLQVSSRPQGLYFPNSYTSGSKEQALGYYSDSCCNPDLQITAINRLNNRRTININAYRASLGPGAIAAIVLGVLVILIIIIVLIVWCLKSGCSCRKKQESYDLPTYRGPATATRRS